MEHTVDEIKEIIESDSDMAPRNKLHALQFTVCRNIFLTFPILQAFQPVH